MDGESTSTRPAPGADRKPATPDEAAEVHRDLIGENLRSYFDKFGNDEMPDRFRELLERLAREEKRK